MNDQTKPQYVFELFSMDPNPVTWLKDMQAFQETALRLLGIFMRDKKTHPGLGIVYLFVPCPGCRRMQEPHVQPVYSYAQFTDDAHKRAFIASMKMLAEQQSAVASISFLDVSIAKDGADEVRGAGVLLEHAGKDDIAFFHVKDSAAEIKTLDDVEMMAVDGTHSPFTGFIHRKGRDSGVTFKPANPEDIQ